MQKQTIFDPTDITAQARRFEDLLHRVENSQMDRRSPSRNAAVWEEASFGGCTLEPAERKE